MLLLGCVLSQVSQFHFLIKSPSTRWLSIGILSSAAPTPTCCMSLISSLIFVLNIRLIVPNLRCSSRCNFFSPSLVFLSILASKYSCHCIVPPTSVFLFFTFVSNRPNCASYIFIAFSFTTTGNIPWLYSVPNIVINNILYLLTVCRGMFFNLREWKWHKYEPFNF